MDGRFLGRADGYALCILHATENSISICHIGGSQSHTSRECLERQWTCRRLELGDPVVLRLRLVHLTFVFEVLEFVLRLLAFNP